MRELIPQPNRAFETRKLVLLSEHFLVFKAENNLKGTNRD